MQLALARVKAEASIEPATPMTFRAFVDLVKPNYRWYWHCEKLADLLQRVADDDLKRLMVFEPPRHGKSELVSRLFPAYYLYRHPDRWCGLNSYGADLAYTLSRAARDNYVKAGGSISGDATAVKHWETSRGGGLWAAGVGGPITGKGFHLGIIDDPLKNAEEAASETTRASQEEWYKSTFSTREEPISESDPDGAVVLIQTRWHEADLAGWLLAEEAGDEPERWHIVSMEAIKDDKPPEMPPSCTLEPDPRQPGEALCPERRPLDKLRQIAARIGSYFWSALFQQRPQPPGGSIFTTFPIVDAAPRNLSLIRYWDKAGSQGKGDWTAGVKMGRTPAGEYYILDVVRGQWSAGKREEVMQDTAALDGVACHVYVETEPGSGGKDSAEASVKGLAGYQAFVDRVTGDKESRARALAAQAEIGNVKLLRGDWNHAFVAECRSFPNGKHDDQVDATSGAFNRLALTPRPQPGHAAILPPTPDVPMSPDGRANVPYAMSSR